MADNKDRATIDKFISRFKDGGARSNQFKVTLRLSANNSSGNISASALNNELQDLEFLCTATSIPASVMNVHTAMYRGRPIKYAGDRQFENWSINIINDGKYSLRARFEEWMNSMAQYTATNGEVNANNYYANGTVVQLDRNGNEIRTYNMQDCFPVQIAGISLDFGTDGLESYQVTFSLNDFYPSVGETTNADTVNVIEPRNATN